jgi:hypothetical protein
MVLVFNDSFPLAPLFFLFLPHLLLVMIPIFLPWTNPELKLVGDDVYKVVLEC